jgi:PAS domain S-box-containing protein
MIMSRSIDKVWRGAPMSSDCGGASGWPVPDPRRSGRPGLRGLRLRSYLVALVVVFVIAAASGVLYGWVRARDNALASARADAAFAARLAATDLHTSVVAAQQAVGQVATSPGLPAALKSPVDPPNCRLSFGDPTAGHIDLVRPDGTVACSSRNADPDLEYTAAPWLSRALAAPLLEGPVPDPTTGWRAAVVTAPVPGGGAVVGVINLQSLGPALADRFGGPRRVELLVTTANDRTIVARSIEPARWVGANAAGTPFATAPGAVERPDVDGVPRLYGQADVEGTEWRVYGGAERGQALSATTQLVRDEILIIAVGLIMALGAALVVHRRIARPIGQLSAGVRAAAADPGTGDVSVAGPIEVERLASDFNGLLGAVDRELTERTRAEEAARELERNYRKLFEANPYPMFVIESGTLAVLQVNDAAVNHYRYSRERFLALSLTDLCLPEDQTAVVESFAQAAPVDHSGPVRHLRQDGSVIEVRVTSHGLSFRGVKARCLVIEDVTDAEQLDRRLRQSQRLESLGQLAGGVAHDFNNLLGVILGYTTMVASEVEQVIDADARWRPLHADLSQVLLAVESATKITRQLLSFARAEVDPARPYDLNTVVSDVEHILDRTLGDDIALQIRLAGDLRGTVGDPGQMEQVLVNLAVNARDAMPSGGSLLISTDNVDLTEHDAVRHPDGRPGPYVRLRVTDTGAGMSRDTVEHAFEPFFTTKPKGKGTGLGLATIYGIVRQAGGHVEIESEPGVGTTVTALLPATHLEAERAEATSAGTATPRGRGELVLLVEDEASLRTLTERILVGHGYRVISAADGAEALGHADRHGADIQLLLTDVVMPNMPGHELARRLLEAHPGLRVVYLSGYAEPFLTARKTLPAGVTLLTKPVTQAVLLTTVRQALDG